jgi:hypothetical protein
MCATLKSDTALVRAALVASAAVLGAEVSLAEITGLIAGDF